MSAFGYLRFEFVELAQHGIEHHTSLPCEAIRSPGAGSSVRIDIASQPTEVLHPMKDGIQGPRADVVSVSPQFQEHPLADDRLFAGMVKYVDLPESQEDLSLQSFRVNRSPGGWFHITEIINDKRK